MMDLITFGSIMPHIESMSHTDDRNPRPWKVNPAMPSQILDRDDQLIADFEVRHVDRGVLANCEKNAEFAVEAVNQFNEGLGEIRLLQIRICEWANSIFPERCTPDILLKMYEELGEYARDPKSPLELADVMILLLDTAYLNGIDVWAAVNAKMDINEKRRWKLDANTRIMRHEEGT
jgi:hypothetical protein